MIKPLVSVIVPAHNCENYIKETLNSVFNQSWTNIEVIVVNDGSTDNTLDVLKNYEIEGNIILINTENRGACHARNIGFSKSKGDYIQFMDSDDLLHPDKIRFQIKCLKGSKDCIVGCDWIKFKGDFNNKIILKSKADDSLRQDLNPVDWLIEAWSNNYMFVPLCWLVPREVILRVGMWDENLKQNQDGEYFARVLLNSKKVLFCKEARVYYRSGLLNSISSGREKKHFESRFKSYISCMNQIFKTEYTIRTKKACACNFRRLSFDVYPKYGDLYQECELEIKKLGVNPRIKPNSGKIFNFLTRLFGWKFATYLKYILYKFGYSKLLIKKKSIF